MIGNHVVAYNLDSGARLPTYEFHLHLITSCVKIKKKKGTQNSACHLVNTL